MQLKYWNQDTYNQIKDYFSRNERCAITNATGTGKTSVITSIIKEYHNNQKVIVIAPRKPILEQYKKDIYGIKDFENIEYLTFSKLSQLNNSGELDTYKNISLIVIDELHRAGAKTWLPCIEKLILNNSKAYVLGASATPKRYEQRYQSEDMVDIVFGGNRCGEYDLKKCIKENILPTPIYVSTLYSVDDEENKINEKINKLSDEDKDSFIKDLKEMRINWEKSRNKEKIINKFLSVDNKIKDKGFKILIFCKNIEHISIIRKEFDPIFKKMYSNYDLKIMEYHSKTNNSGFCEFKEDIENNTVQILYSVDKFNEGIHIDNLDAIIMLRETTSEIIYYQQLGRVLSLSGRKNPIIIDIVNNSDKVKGDSILRELMKEYSYKDISNIEKDNLIQRDIPVGFYNYVRDINELFHSIEQRIVEKTLYEYNGEKGTLKYFSNKYNKDLKIIHSKIKMNNMTIEEAILTTDDLSGLNVEWEGFSGSLEEVCNKFKVNTALIKYRMDNRNLTFKEAMETVKK